MMVPVEAAQHALYEIALLVEDLVRDRRATLLLLQAEELVLEFLDALVRGEVHVGRLDTDVEEWWPSQCRGRRPAATGRAKQRGDARIRGRAQPAVRSTPAVRVITARSR